MLECPGPYDPSLLAYGQNNHPPCYELSGPVAEGQSSEGGISCCYRLETRACCDASFESDFCIDIPYFGDGTRSVSLPTVAVDDPANACGSSAGSPIELSHVEAAERLIGVWLACVALPQPFRGDGFIFRGDGTFHAIVLDDDLHLSETEGCMQCGLWGFLAGTSQMNLSFEDLTQMQHLTFTSGPVERVSFATTLGTISFVRATLPAGG